MDRGELVSDEVMIDIVRDRLDRNDARGGFILDGFPRTVAQAAALDEIMKGRDPLIIVDIVVPEAELVRRLSTRLICKECGHNAELGHVDVKEQCAICGGELMQRTGRFERGGARASEGLPYGDQATGGFLSRAADVSIGERRSVSRSCRRGSGRGDCRGGHQMTREDVR